MAMSDAISGDEDGTEANEAGGAASGDSQELTTGGGVMRPFSSISGEDFGGLTYPERLAFDIFKVFSRFERALKRSGFVGIYRGTNVAKPDWASFASRHEGDFDWSASEELENSARYILSDIPNVLMYNEESLHWGHRVLFDREQEYGRLGKLILYINVVRNNLFHGEKNDLLEGIPLPRSIELVRGSLIILKQCLELNEDVKRHFYAGLPSPD